MKIERVDNELAKVLNVIISREMKDPRLSGLISVTAVETAKDLKTAKVYVSIMDEDGVKGAIDALNGASAYIRSLLFDRVKMRTVPHLTFIRDNSLNNGYKIEAILKELHIEKEENEE